MPEAEDIYQDHILDHYECPYNRGHCDHATHTHEDTNPLCGDRVHIELRVEGDVVREAWFEGEGCCISQASASMLMEALEGKTLAEISRISAEDMLAMLGVRLTPNRQNCCLLPWRVAQVALHSEAPASSARVGRGRDQVISGSASS